MTFLNPLLLIGALGIALPILAHLINRQQVQRTDWAAMQFLNRSMRVRSRQIRLRDILLLLMRCLALLLLVFAIARPATTGAGGSWLPGEARAGVVIALDSSFSMSHSDGNTTRFERAIEQVNVIAESIKPGDPVSLVMLGGENRVVLRNVAYDPDRFAEVLSQQQPTPNAMELDSVPKQLESLVEDMDAVQKEVYLVTDTQATNWEQTSAPLREALTQLKSVASVFLVPIKGSEANLAVTNLDLLSGSLRNGAVARYRATVHNFGMSPVSNVEVRCRVEGVQIDSKQIPLIPAGSSETVSLFVPFYNAGPTQITAEITDQSLEQDNIRRVVAVVRERVSVLCLDGSGGDASRLITAGLLARSSGTEDEGYTVRSVQWPSFPAEGLDAFDVVVLTDVPEITKDQAEALGRFVRQGNGLVWFAGDNVKAAQWNQLTDRNGNPLLPAKLGSVVDARDNLGVGKPLAPNMPDHTVIRPLKSLPEDLLSETRFLRQMQIESAETSFSVLNLAGSGSPILIEQSRGRGHVFQFTTSADAAWNNMALTPVFPMLMQQIVTYLSGREFEQPRVVGDTLTLSYVDQPDANDAVFESPSEETITVPVRTHRNQFVALLEQSTETGFYTAKVSVQAPGMPIAVNVDTQESDVACLDDAALIERLDGTGIEIVANEGDLASGISLARTGRSSWRFFMLAALCLLIGESLFADRILGRKSSQKTTRKNIGTPSPQSAEVA
ncbi:MAG: BatA domain-containing protein [Phycisphaeraceae bacterium]